MNANTIETAETPETKAPQPKGKRTTAKKAKTAKTAKTAKKTHRHKKAGDKPKAERTNKRAEVLAMMKRAKGVTLAEIMTATGWQPHTVRGFVSILGSKGREKVESSKNETGERTYRIAK